jgi:hypothetical protein
MSDPSEPLLRIRRIDFFVHGGRLEGNILHSGAEVLVSSASSNAAMRGGVSLAILRKGGQSILEGLRAHKLKVARLSAGMSPSIRAARSWCAVNSRLQKRIRL